MLSKTYYESTDDISQTQQQLASLCHAVPPTLKEPCDELLQYRSILEVAITSDADSLTACQAVDFCTEWDQTDLDISTANTVGIPPVECQACQWAVSAVEGYLSQDPNVEDLGVVLQNLCTVLPQNYSQLCKNFIVLYLDEAMLVVLDSLTPPYVCKIILGLCV